MGMGRFLIVSLEGFEGARDWNFGGVLGRAGEVSKRARALRKEGDEAFLGVVSVSESATDVALDAMECCEASDVRRPLGTASSSEAGEWGDRSGTSTNSRGSGVLIASRAAR